MTGPAGADLAIRHADVVHPKSATVDRDRLLRITAGRIAAVEPDPGSPVGRRRGRRDRPVRRAGAHRLPRAPHAISTDLGSVADQSPAYVAARAGVELRRMLGRGFTSVRDAGGADFGLAAAVEEDLYNGPRVFFCGRALSQTGGHGDLRPAGRDVHDPDPAAPVLGVVCDGVTRVRRAARQADPPRRPPRQGHGVERVRQPDGPHRLSAVLQGGAARRG